MTPETKAAADAIIATVKRLEARIAELEKQQGEILERGIRYCGVHQRAMSYRTGDVTTHKGSLWACVRATEAVPGESGDWQLVVKGGAQ